jgi:hypothetical protein
MGENVLAVFPRRPPPAADQKRSSELAFALLSDR